MPRFRNCNGLFEFRPNPRPDIQKSGEKADFLLAIGISLRAAPKRGLRGADVRSSMEARIPNGRTALEHLGYRGESRLRVQERNYQGLLLLVHPPAEGFFRRELGSLQWNARLAVRRGVHFVRILVIDADAGRARHSSKKTVDPEHFGNPTRGRQPPSPKTHATSASQDARVFLRNN